MDTRTRFNKSLQADVELFTASIFFDSKLAEFDIIGSLAHAQMLGEVGILTPEEAEKICEGLLILQQRFAAGKISFTAADEDIHMKVESELKNLIGPLAGKLHTARSRNDQVALDLHLYLRHKIRLCVQLIRDLQQALLDKAEAYSDVIMPGYTHLQRAQPILFSHHLLAYVAMLQRDCERLQDSWPRVNQMPLGAGALAGTGFPIDRARVAHLLHFDSLYENSLDAVSDRDFIVEFLATAALLMTHLSRLSEELILWSSQEFAFISLDDAYCSGSSMMPQKKNPDVPELVRGKTGRVYGALLGLLTTLKGLPLAYNKDLQEDKEALFDTVETLEAVLTIYKGLITTLHVHKDTMLCATQEGFLAATDLADYLVCKKMPFREAHALVGTIVRHCIEKAKKLEDLSLSEWQQFSPLFSQDVFPWLEIQKVVERRNSRGGTSSQQVKNQCALYKIALDKTSEWLFNMSSY